MLKGGEKLSLAGSREGLHIVENEGLGVPAGGESGAFVVASGGQAAGDEVVDQLLGEVGDRDMGHLFVRLRCGDGDGGGDCGPTGAWCARDEDRGPRVRRRTGLFHGRLHGRTAGHEGVHGLDAACGLVGFGRAMDEWAVVRGEPNGQVEPPPFVGQVNGIGRFFEQEGRWWRPTIIPEQSDRGGFGGRGGADDGETGLIIELGRNENHIEPPLGDPDESGGDALGNLDLSTGAGEPAGHLVDDGGGGRGHEQASVHHTQPFIQKAFAHDSWGSGIMLSTANLAAMTQSRVWAGEVKRAVWREWVDDPGNGWSLRAEQVVD